MPRTKRPATRTPRKSRAKKPKTPESLLPRTEPTPLTELGSHEVNQPTAAKRPKAKVVRKAKKARSAPSAPAHLLHRGIEILRKMSGHTKTAEYIAWEKDLGIKNPDPSA